MGDEEYENKELDIKGIKWTNEGEVEMLASFDAPGHVDQALWDETNHRAYALGGEGWITIIQENDVDHFVELPRLITAAGAKTGIIVPERNEMFVVASPGESKAMAQVLRISIAH